MSEKTHMQREIEEIPEAVARLLDAGRSAIGEAADTLKVRAPGLLATVARGSSDHAATYLKYACELLTGVPVASIGPSIASVYGAKPKLADAACLGISQSGQSPDIVQMMRAAEEAGAATIAITNDPGAPLAQSARHVLPMHAGPEISVAATKTYVTSLVAGLALIARWTDDRALLAALDQLPAQLARAVALDWPELRAEIAETAGACGMFVLGRGPSFAVAGEAALKFKETCRIQAEPFSSAEVLHGPVSVVGEGFPVLALISRDAAESGIVEVCERLAAQGAAVFGTSDRLKAARRLDFVPTGHALTDPVSLIASFYAFVEKLARARGIDPDAPRHLKKVTETV